MEPVDMRKQFQGLQGIVNEEFGRYLTQDEAFIFIGKTRKTAKVLHRESDGLTLYVRKLSEGRFQMPHFNDDNRTTTLTPDEFTLLILGEVTAELLIHDSLESLKLLAHIDWLHAQVVLQVIRQLTNSSHKPTLLY
jgi:transposase